MENTLTADNRKPNKFLQGLSSIWGALHNRTFLYILKRLLSAIITLLLLAILVTALLRCLPDTLFYNVKDYNKIYAQAGEVAAQRWLTMKLYPYGIVDIHGNRISVLQSVGTFIYWILPIWKKIPIAWNQYTYEPIKYWEGLIYLGRSASMQNAFVTDLLAERMPLSFGISLITVLLTYIVAIPLGIAMAKKPGGVADKVGNIFIVLNYAIPALVFYLIMNQVFGWAEINGERIFGFFYDASNPASLFPPIFCMWFLSIPGVSIWIRRYMTDELSSDYVKFARSKGLPERTIMYKHVFRNACVPLVRSIPATLLFAIVGSYYVEYIWKIKGTGILLITGLQGSAPDIQLIQGLTIIYGAISMLAFLLGDLITVFFDPRIKLEGN